MTDLAIRLVSLAGPAVSVLVGVVGFMIWRSLSHAASHGRFLTWLLGTIALLQATGYLLFSGITGLGDFGTSRDGALYQLSPEWAWRVAITVLGVIGYGLVIYLSLRAMDRMIGGEGAERVPVREPGITHAAGATAGVDVVSHWRGRVGADRTTQPAWAGHRADIGGSLQPGRHLGAGLDDANAQAGRGARPVAPASGPQLGLGDRGGWW